MENKNRYFCQQIGAWTTNHLGIRLRLFFILALSLLLTNPLVACKSTSEQMIVLTDVSQYGHYTGTGADSFVQAYIDYFFPDRIDDSFSNLKYVYKTSGSNNYDFEAYLEFTITDTDAFFQYVEDIAPESAWEPFTFDTDYQIYTIENSLDILEGMVSDTESYLYHPIERARIRSVLYHAESQAIIFWALGVYDGGAIGTNFLNTFFERFGIDPVIYEQTADSPHGKDPFEIE